MTHYSQKILLMKDGSLNISTKTMVTLIMFLDDKSILESEYRIGGVQTTVVENDIENVINHSVLLKDLAELNSPKIK